MPVLLSPQKRTPSAVLLGSKSVASVGGSRRGTGEGCSPSSVTIGPRNHQTQLCASVCLLPVGIGLMQEDFTAAQAMAQPPRFVDATGCSMVVWRCSFASKTVTCGPGYLFFISCAAFSAASYVSNPDLSCRSTAT